MRRHLLVFSILSILAGCTGTSVGGFIESSTGANLGSSSSFQRSSLPTATAIEINDSGASVLSIKVPRGEKFSLTVKVGKENVNHGGLGLKSDITTTSFLRPGRSQTVRFVTDRSFELLPYWTGIGSNYPYRISVKVE